MSKFPWRKARLADDNANQEDEAEHQYDSHHCDRYDVQPESASQANLKSLVKKTLAVVQEESEDPQAAESQALSECIRATIVPYTDGEEYLEPPTRQCTKCQSHYSAFRVHPFSVLDLGPLPLSEACPTCYEETATALYLECKKHHDLLEPTPPTQFMPLLFLDDAEYRSRPSAFEHHQPNECGGYGGPLVRTCTQCSEPYTAFLVRPYDGHDPRPGPVDPVSRACWSCYKTGFRGLITVYWRHLELLDPESSAQCYVPETIKLRCIFNEPGGSRPMPLYKECCSKLGVLRAREPEEAEAAARAEERQMTPDAAIAFAASLESSQPDDRTTTPRNQSGTRLGEDETELSPPPEYESVFGPTGYGSGQAETQSQLLSEWVQGLFTATRGTTRQKRTWRSRLSRLFSRKSPPDPLTNAEDYPWTIEGLNAWVEDVERQYGWATNVVT